MAMKDFIAESERRFDERFGQFYVSIDSKTKAVRIVDIVNGIKVNGEDGTLIECVASGDIKQYLRAELLRFAQELEKKVEGMKREEEVIARGAPPLGFEWNKCLSAVATLLRDITK